MVLVVDRWIEEEEGEVETMISSHLLQGMEVILMGNFHILHSTQIILVQYNRQSGEQQLRTRKQMRQDIG